MTIPAARPRRVSRVTIALVIPLLAGLGAWGWFGGRAYAQVKRDEAAMARIDAHKPKALLDLRMAEDARLHAGPLPIEEAMKRVATAGRTGLGPSLTPVPSNDTAPLMGWGYQPHDVPEWMLAPAPSASAVGPNAADAKGAPIPPPAL